MAKKYIGWGRVTKTDGQIITTIVPAKSKKEAIKIFEGLGLSVQDEKHIRHVCIVLYPGPLSVKAMKINKWEDCFAITGKEAMNG